MIFLHFCLSFCKPLLLLMTFSLLKKLLETPHTPAFLRPGKVLSIYQTDKPNVIHKKSKADELEHLLASLALVLSFVSVQVIEAVASIWLLRGFFSMFTCQA